MGFAFWRIADLNLAGSDALAEARAQRLDRRFLGGEAAGQISCRRVGQAVQFLRAEDFFRKAAAEARVDIADAVQIGQIHPQAHDHNDPRRAPRAARRLDSGEEMPYADFFMPLF